VSRRLKDFQETNRKRSFMALRRSLPALFALALSATGATAATIGVVAPQSGPYTLLGGQVMSGARAAAETDGSTVVAIDETCEAGSGAAVAQKLTAAKVDAAIGFLCAETLQDALPLLKSANIAALTVSVRSKILMEDALKFGWPLFRLAPADGAEADKLVETILRDWQGKPFALVEDGTIHGRELAEAIRNALEQAGMKPLFSDTYRPGQEQQIALVRRLNRTGVTHVFVGGDRNDTATIARDAAAEKIRLTILGGDAMKAANQPQALAEGVLAVTLPDYGSRPEAVAIAAALRAKNVEPEGYVLPAYAAASVVQQATVAAKAQSKPVAAVLAGPFSTVIGPVAFDARHELGVNPYRLQQWHDNRFADPGPPGE
jgi:branched-chain amino acid transport system substrate-binding protein